VSEPADRDKPAATEAPPDEKPKGTQEPGAEPGKDLPQAAVKGERKPIGKYVSPADAEPSVLLQRTDESGPWQRLAHNAAVHTEEQLMSLPGFRSQLQLERGLHVQLWGALAEAAWPVVLLESAVVLRDTPELDLDLALRRGRVVLANAKPAGPARARVRFHEEVWELTLEKDAEVAIEVSGSPTFDYTKDLAKAGAPRSDVGLFVLKGQAVLKAGARNHPLSQPKGPALFHWSNVAGTDPGPQTMDSPPVWASKPRGGVAPRMIQALENLSRALRGRPVDVVLTETARDTEPTSQRLGVYCLAAVGDVARVLDALADERSAEARPAAVTTLRHWMGLDAANDASLYRALEQKYGPNPAEIMMILLHGYSAEARSKPEVYEQLVEYLRSDNLAIRELALRQLSVLPETRDAAKTIPYDPTGGTEQRQAAYNRWKELVRTGKVPAKPAPAGARGGNSRGQ
jgi:hypothetical protein